MLISISYHVSLHLLHRLRSSQERELGVLVLGSGGSDSVGEVLKEARRQNREAATLSVIAPHEVILWSN